MWWVDIWFQGNPHSGYRFGGHRYLDHSQYLLGEGIKITISLPLIHKCTIREARDHIVKAIEKSDISWIKPTGKLWTIDLSALIPIYARLECLTWLKGKLDVEPEIHIEEDSFKSGFAKSYKVKAEMIIKPDDIPDPKELTIFYSWTDDFTNQSNRTFIEDCIEKALKKLSRDGDIKIIPRIDKDTAGHSGAVNLLDVILWKIDNSIAVVSDTTLINEDAFLKAEEDRAKGIKTKIPKLTSNPNVLFELGYAGGRLRWENVIAVMNTAFGKGPGGNVSPKDLPFDLGTKRVLTYSFRGDEGEDLKKAQKEALIGKLSSDLKIILKRLEGHNEAQQEK